jgi:hypothetical protein
MNSLFRQGLPVQKISKKNQDPNQVHEDKIGIDRLLSKKSQHFEPGTFVIYKNKRYLLLCFRESDGRMVLDSEDETLALDTYSMLWG